jgi:NADH-quinone oxidoreductase subunit L
MSVHELISGALLAIIGMQACWCMSLGVLALLGQKLSERFICGGTRLIYAGVFALSVAASCGLLGVAEHRVVVYLGHWSLATGFDFRFLLQIDPLTVPFLLLAAVLCPVVAVFSERYMHKESGHFRFFWMLCVFALGYFLTVLAGSIEVLYSAWELLGLSSALLIGFFHRRPGPVRNGLYAFIVYRVCDLGLVLASVFWFERFHTGDFAVLLGSQAWPHGHTPASAGTAMLVGAFLLLAASGKAAQLPFSGWLPRAMEGPTPSTAIFYGALSVHAGAYLLLRCSPLLNASPPLTLAVVVIGFSTAVMARQIGRLQSDIKTSLAYASLAQVGLIFAEIGLGFRLLPIAHALGHATLRSIQFLKAPSLLHEIHELHSALGELHTWQPVASTKRERWLYRFFLERAYVDALVERVVVTPLLLFGAALRRLDAWVIERLAGPAQEVSE